MHHVSFTFSAMQAKPENCTDCVGLNETALSEPPRPDLHLLRLCSFYFRLKPLFQSIDMSKFKTGRVHCSEPMMKGLKYILKISFSLQNTFSSKWQSSIAYTKMICKVLFKTSLACLN